MKKFILVYLVFPAAFWTSVLWYFGAFGAEGQPVSNCQVTTAADGTAYYSNCGPPSEHSPRDNASAS